MEPLKNMWTVARKGVEVNMEFPGSGPNTSVGECAGLPVLVSSHSSIFDGRGHVFRTGMKKDLRCSDNLKSGDCARSLDFAGLNKWSTPVAPPYSVGIRQEDHVLKNRKKLACWQVCGPSRVLAGQAFGAFVA